MDRRHFIKNSMGIAVAGTTLVNGFFVPDAFASRFNGLPVIDISSPHLTRLVLKPVMTNMYHTAEWEGPCRFNVVPSGEEKKRALDSFANFSERLTKNEFKLDPSNIELLDPSLLLFVEDFKLNEADLLQLDKEMAVADAIFIDPSGASKATYDIAARYKKPVIFAWGLNCRIVDISAYCRSLGLEAFTPNSTEETNEIARLLRARKVFSNTRILYPTNWGWPSVASVAGINEPEKLKDRFGIELKTISFDELSLEMEITKSDHEERKKAEEMAAILYDNAEKTYLNREYAARSLEFYNTIIRLMKKHDCNAFTIECFEFCSSRLPQKWNITPCLVHTLFKDLGIPSACEGDLGGLLSMHLLMSLSRKSSHMGNMFYSEEGRMEINHSVPGLKMNGFDQDPLPYQLGRFVESGWGTKAVVDFMENEEKTVTVARMNPTATGLLVLKGKLVGSKGYNEDLRGCSVSAYIVGKESGSADEFVRKQADYGNHLVWVYGDYTEELVKLGDLLKIKVDLVS
jgi:L-fucose isomerase-like protein